jgi:hypothetical protein
MELQLSAKGTVTDCREELNAVIAALPTPETQENKVVRMIAHYIVAEYLDKLHDPWQADAQALRGAGRPEPPEPRASFAVDCTITLG